MPSVTTNKCHWDSSLRCKDRSISEEFCDQVIICGQIRGFSDFDLDFTEELKCFLNINFLPELVSHMVDAGYCCSQVQRDERADKCFAWFQRMRLS